jgi:hypothetical protein
MGLRRTFGLCLARPRKQAGIWGRTTAATACSDTHASGQREPRCTAGLPKCLAIASPSQEHQPHPKPKLEARQIFSFSSIAPTLVLLFSINRPDSPRAHPVGIPKRSDVLSRRVGGPKKVASESDPVTQA